LSISSGSRLVSIGVLITYPIVISKVSSSKKSFYKLSTFVDPYVRLIHEIANNLGFISVVVSIETFLNKLRQERKEDKNEA
jgi:Ni,Fe-hydrogenase I cytochrome b subunit